MHARTHACPFISFQSEGGPKTADGEALFDVIIEDGGHQAMGVMPLMTPSRL